MIKIKYVSSYAIQTRMLPSSSSKSQRMMAWSAIAQTSIGYDHKLSLKGNHERAFGALMEKLKLTDVEATYVNASLNNGDMAWIRLD